MPGTDERSIQSVVVVGGGTAGYFAALAIKRALTRLDVTLVESSKIPIIGVGEATTTLMPPFLHRQLGIDICELYREVRPTWKLGIKFLWGPGDDFFCYPFGFTAPIEAYAHDGNITNQSLAALMMRADRVPIVRSRGGAFHSLLPLMKFAYHLDNKPFVAYLATAARRAGIHHVDAEVARVETTADRENVERLILHDGRELRGDLYIDASGFRALLIEGALGSPFLSFAESLYCDTAVVGEVPQLSPIEPYTTAETMEAGWCWRIPVEGADHRGYVHSSAHLSVDRACDEMRAKNPGLRDPWTVRFRSGRHQDFWKGNTVAIGNAYGFVEPLQSTALHMVILEIAYVIAALRSAAGGRIDRARANQAVGSHWDFLRWFLAIHYRYNRRSDSNFWRECRESVDVSGMQPLIEDFITRGPWDQADGSRYATGDPAFSFEGIMIMLLGQRLPCPRPQRSFLSRRQWDARVSECRALVDRALTQKEALDLLRKRPEMLDELVTSADSWINRGDELGLCMGSEGGAAEPPPDPPLRARGAYGHLIEGLHEPAGRGATRAASNRAS